MEKRIYDRCTGELYEEKQFKDRELRLLYHHPLGRLLLSGVVARPWFSRLYARPYSRKGSVGRIRPFIREYGIDMGEYPEREYDSFNDFFTRRILPEKRPLPEAPNVLIAPADSKLLALDIDSDMLLTVKGAAYTLPSLMRDAGQASRYRGGICLIFRLTVDDYHRYCFVDDGRLLTTREIPGRLHTVGPVSQGKYRVYSENHRICSVLATDHFGELVMLEVGALLVGRIINHPVTVFKRGQEKGYFAYGGSTILLLLEKGRILLDEDIAGYSRKGIETRVRLGEAIGRTMENEPVKFDGGEEETDACR